MGKVKAIITMSLDGYVAGPDQSEENPLGVGGEELHEWVFPLKVWRESHGDEGGEVTASSPVVEGWSDNVGAMIMGRNMFGGGPGPWGENPWTGWWGDNPPYHIPVFVLTHYEREPLEMEGDTTFHFVTEGIGSALDRAREAAGEGGHHGGRRRKRDPAIPGRRTGRRAGDLDLSAASSAAGSGSSTTSTARTSSSSSCSVWRGWA